MSKLTIPEEAMPVVEILRRDVERPTGKIIAKGDGDSPWLGPRFECGKCPMGLHPTALRLTPAAPSSFTKNSPLRELNRLKSDNLNPPGLAFWQWWDSLTVEQAYEAVDLIWPKEGK